MRFGYWMPVFGGWLRNVDDEGMEATWSYAKRVAQRSEQIGFDLTLVAELNLNDIKGMDAPSLDAWSTTAALAAVTERLEIMTAVPARQRHLCTRASRGVGQASTDWASHRVRGVNGVRSTPPDSGDSVRGPPF